MVIPDDSARTSVLLQARLCLTLESATEEWHWYENRQNALLMFWLHFPGVPVLAVRGSGEVLQLEESTPHSSYDMREYGQSKVGPGRKPSLLAAFVGSRLRDATLIWGYSTEPAVEGVLFQFDTGSDRHRHP